jgi:hypothetical protein
MKKKITTIICALVSLGSFANAAESSIMKNGSQVSLNAKMLPRESSEVKQGIVYVRFLATDPSVFTQYQVNPGVGVGYRRLKGRNGFDVLGAFASRVGHGRDAYTWTLPKVSYLHYLNPLGDQTVYLGAGLGFGGIESKRTTGKGLQKRHEQHEFIGLLGHITAGVEWCRREACVLMSEFGVTQPLVPANNPKGFSGPSAEISLGLGF